MTEVLSSPKSTELAPNPFVQIREDHGLTQEQFRRDLGLSSTQVIRRIEQGLYGYPTPKVTQYLADLEGISCDHLLAEYYIWQREVRKHNCPTVLAGIQRYIDAPRGFKLADFIRTVTPESRMAFCKLLCVNPAQIDPVAGRRDLPGFIKEALQDALVDDMVIDRVNHIMAFGRRL